MASAQAKTAEQNDEAGGGEVPRRSRRKLFLAAGVAVLILTGGGVAWATGTLAGLAGGEAKQVAGAAEGGAMDLPDIVANLNTGGRRNSFVRVKARLQLTAKLDESTATARTPRLLDLFQTYLRDMRPDELRGSAGTYRLREELMARANIIMAPNKVTDVLFVELLIQ